MALRLRVGRPAVSPHLRVLKEAGIGRREDFLRAAPLGDFQLACQPHLPPWVHRHALLNDGHSRMTRTIPKMPAIEAIVITTSTATRLAASGDGELPT